MTSSQFPRDFLDMFSALQKHGVRYLIVGAEAVIYYGFARLTGDIDIFFEPSPENCLPLFSALKDFWAGEVPGIKSASDLTLPGMVIQFGYPPNRIDLLNSVSGVTFTEAWKDKTVEKLAIGSRTINIHYIGLASLIKNKESIGRPKDIEDLKYLREALKKKNPRL
jgi:hypothetical protein